LPVRQISEHCLQIRRFNLMNCYLVREPDGLTLVDSALGCASIIREAARHMGAPIRRIALTHGHMDHAGSVDALRKALPQIEVICGLREARLIAEARRDVKPKDMTLLPEEPQEAVKGSFTKLKEEPSRHVSEGDSIGSLQVFATPGHTPGHVAFYDPRDGSFYAATHWSRLAGCARHLIRRHGFRCRRVQRGIFRPHSRA
jgi:glyoxylase-like metal-dependent hydrolase (beta-lactamase superfamily II)